MIVDRKPWIYVWRPFHRIVFETLVWPVVRIIGAVLNAQLLTQLAMLQENVNSLQRNNEQLLITIANLNRRIAIMEQESMAQWVSLEKLLLCVIRDPRDDVRGHDDLAAPSSGNDA